MSGWERVMGVVVGVVALATAVAAVLVFGRWGRSQPAALPDLEILPGVEVEGEKDRLPMSVIAGRAGDLDWPLTGLDVVVGRIYRRRSDGTVERIQKSDIQPDDRIFIDFYRRPGLVRGIVSQIVMKDDGWNLELFDDDTSGVYSLGAQTPFEAEDASGLFWKNGEGVDKLKVGDGTELTLSSGGRVEKIKYLAPVLGAGRGRIKLVADKEGEKIIRIADSPLLIRVGAGTIIYDENQPGTTYGMDKVADGVKAYVMYYMDKGLTRAKSVGVTAY